MQFHLIVASILLKTCIKDMFMEIAPTGDKDFISMYRGALVSGFVNISVYFNKLLLDRFLNKFNILLVRDDSRKICGSLF